MLRSTGQKFDDLLGGTRDMNPGVRRVITTTLNLLLRPFGLTSIPKPTIRSFRQSAETLAKLLLVSRARSSAISLEESLRIVDSSRSQNGQDLFALLVGGFSSGGFFVEFGATDGITSSNTYLLEKHFAWTGILAEPARRFGDQLRTNRSVSISNECVWKESGKNLLFLEAKVPELSTLSIFRGADLNRRSQKKAASYEVKTITLEDLLRRFNAPRVIDFISIDTEGSEFEILQAFDFSKHVFNAICVEHNYSKSRKLIRDLLTSNGYVQVCDDISGWDDWFVAAHLADRFLGQPPFG